MNTSKETVDHLFFSFLASISIVDDDSQRGRNKRADKRDTKGSRTRLLAIEDR